jgi:hypothetical protein
MKRAYLIQILLPNQNGKGEPVSREWFERLLEELVAQFGGATSFVRSPGKGLWRDGSSAECDTIAVVEIMVAELAKDYWRTLRERLEGELSQEEIVIRAHEIARL